MKVRIGFVSNSSSSSFVAVGIGAGCKREDEQEFLDILKAIGISKEYDWQEIESHKGLKDYDYGVYKTTDGSDVCLYGGYEFDFIGFDAEQLLKQDLKLSQIKKRLQKAIKKHYKVDVPLEKIEFRCGTTSSE